MNYGAENSMINPFSITIPHYEQPIIQNLYEKECYKSYLRVMEANAKVDFSEEKKVETYRKKLKMREEYEERKRCFREVVKQAPDGCLMVVSENLEIESRPRIFTNLRFPELVVLKSLENKFAPKCYWIRGQIEMRQVEVFLSDEKILKGNYMLQKFASSGVIFKSAKRSQVNNLLIDYIGRMISRCKEEISLPDRPGWYLTDEGEYKFLEEEDLTWEKVEKMI